MSEDTFNHVVYSRNVLEFVTVAGEYCKLAESAEQIDLKSLVSKLQKIVALLYLKASMLPEVEEMLEEAPEKFVTEDDYDYLLRILKRKFGEHDAYYEVFDPMIQYSETPLPASLSENLTDIYQDLKDFILAYRVGNLEVMNDALFECRKNFEDYWGQLLVNGLRAIHNLLYGGADLSEENRFKIPKIQTEEEPEDEENPDWILKQQFKNFREEE
ncbi:MAG: DUF5063 domain-containing protein [Bacteroidota bacterium]|nr:DUF5063 domain-containing protein [Bacteroidota bacterium]MDP4206104.1 DUF5063 domain-containing protein [Bacteroidota bacterium]